MGKWPVAAAVHVKNRRQAEVTCFAVQDRRGHAIHHEADLASATLQKHVNGKEILRDALVSAADTTEWRKKDLSCL